MTELEISVLFFLVLMFSQTICSASYNGSISTVRSVSAITSTHRQYLTESIDRENGVDDREDFVGGANIGGNNASTSLRSNRDEGRAIEATEPQISTTATTTTTTNVKINRNGNIAKEKSSKLEKPIFGVLLFLGSIFILVVGVLLEISNRYKQKEEKASLKKFDEKYTLL
ncbi:uncharacterized protein LOC106870196 [Octopus bimaculoides]|uniref:Syndecan/Neurexin domain-containing protein n=1 Tax=Octopus bimaculoides TaxID=37653 RepID=A0A0L8HLE5_OCTBM|nr:uncharacterized protein LOC106870196 [Octopus bimaculoides]|eukprot:XP_014771687.1 PREDICTED: uncharacterized protein LOC106870196 [Octopus bimaculoides]